MNTRKSSVYSVWISNGDIILVGLRSYQDQKADVIMKYQNDEARTLKSLGEIPDTVKLEENNDIQFDANAALLEEDGEEGSASGSDDDEDESGSNDGDSDDSDDVEESIQRYRYDYGGGKDMRSNRRK
ncbi:Translation initiation factor eIF-1A [Paragonimus heterotremus]|uniref:Translation initiation factor eIF-1A n=1 Tax=Paragonimus heterotremus TaxID=100268 RepID=A0A8J4WMM4_9TREM|nr:Translation initiation factor eIF-1A [Paragonimus heterotremus]